MCAGCFSHLLADARLKDETATCPNCRCEITKNICSRNLAVEKAICELPTECHYCARQYPRIMLNTHQREHCSERYYTCSEHFFLSRPGLVPTILCVYAQCGRLDTGGCLGNTTRHCVLTNHLLNISRSNISPFLFYNKNYFKI